MVLMPSEEQYHSPRNSQGPLHHPLALNSA